MIHPLKFFAAINWIDGQTPLLNVIEPYRQAIFAEVLYTFEADGIPRYNFALTGRAKKNWKTADAVSAVLYRFFAWEDPSGNDAFIVCNDADQAQDGLVLASKIVRASPILDSAAIIREKWIARRDGHGVLQILPAQDVIGMHGKTYNILACDEVHGWKTYDVFEALAPDPSRRDALIWVTSYASIYNRPGVPLHDFIERGKAGTDRGMYFSWYASDFSTDPAFQNASPEERANPSIKTWNNPGYLAQQRRRLPTHKYRRLHLNLPGMPEGAYFDAEAVGRCVVEGRRRLRRLEGVRHVAYVDMSGGSSDDCVLAVAHCSPEQKGVLDVVLSQAGRPPFDPRQAVKRFAEVLADFGVTKVHGDAYAGQTFRKDFEGHGITYVVASRWNSASDIYDAAEPAINAGEFELLDHEKLVDQILGLVTRGNKITHQSGEHDDFPNSALAALLLAKDDRARSVLVPPLYMSGPSADAIEDAAAHEGAVVDSGGGFSDYQRREKGYRRRLPDGL